MSSMKQYLNSFRVNAGLAPDDRVLAETAASASPSELEEALMKALKATSKKWSYAESEVSHGPPNDPENAYDLPTWFEFDAYRPEIEFNAEDGEYQGSVVFAPPDRSGYFNAKDPSDYHGLVLDKKYDGTGRHFMGIERDRRYREPGDDARLKGAQTDARKMFERVFPDILKKAFPEFTAHKLYEVSLDDPEKSCAFNVLFSFEPKK